MDSRYNSFDVEVMSRHFMLSNRTFNIEDGFKVYSLFSRQYQVDFKYNHSTT